MEDRDSLIASIKSEELVRADLAEASYKEFLRKQSENHSKLDDDDRDILTMEVIDNCMRETDLTHEELAIVNDPPRGRGKQKDKVKC